MKEFQNPNGTYNGVKMFASLTGLSEAEITWTFNRLKQLAAEGKLHEERKAIVAEEVKRKPWLTAGNG